jgi:tetratricopeptide (TPR) repeat protein
VIKSIKRPNTTEWLIYGLVGIVFISIFLIIFPHFRGLYYQVHGGRDLDAATNTQMRNGFACAQDFNLTVEQISLLQRSVKYFEMALQSDPHLEQAELQRGIAYCFLNEQQKAVGALKAYTYLRPNNPLGHLELGFLYDANGDSAQAIVEWSAARVSWQDFFTNGEQARQEKDYVKALFWYQKAKLLAPQIGDLNYSAGLVNQSMGDMEQALISYQTALEASYFQNITLGNIYYRLGMLYQADSEIQNLDTALEMYQYVFAPQSLSSDETQANAHYKIGEIYLRQGRDGKDSIDEYRQALQLDPSHYWAHFRLGRALYDVYHNIHDAEVEFHLAIDFWPDDPSKKWPYRALGDIYVDADMIDEAIEAYKAALQLDPSDTEVETKLAQLQAP